MVKWGNKGFKMIGNLLEPLSLLFYLFFLFWIFVLAAVSGKVLGGSFAGKIIKPLFAAPATFLLTWGFLHKAGKNFLQDLEITIDKQGKKPLFLGLFWGFILALLVFIANIIQLRSPTVVLAWQKLGWQKAGENLVLGLATFAGSSTAQEIPFRGYLLSRLKEKFALNKAIVLSAFVFALFHLPAQPSFLTLLNLFLGGLVLALGRVKSSSLNFSLGLHFAWKFSLSTIFGLPPAGPILPMIFLFTHKLSEPPTSTWFTTLVFTGSLILLNLRPTPNSSVS